MSETMKKNAEMNELLAEAKDMELGDETGASISIDPLITRALRCGLVLTLSAECNASHKSCGIH